MTEIDIKVVEIIQAHKGYANKIGRKALLRAVHMAGFAINDRGLQEIIERRRANGIPICSTSSDGGGYYMPVSFDEFQSFNREQMSRVKKISAKQAKMKRAARKMFPESLPLLGE